MARLLCWVTRRAALLILAVEACGTRGSEATPPVTTVPPSPGSTPDAGGQAEPGADTASPAQPAGPEPPSIRLVGRFDTRDPQRPLCGWPGCRILANFEGSSVTVQLTEYDEDWMIGAPSEWDYAIDGVWKPKLVLAPGSQTFKLAAGLGPGSHRVELYKRSEAQNGITEFDGFDFGPGGRLLSPPPRRKRGIEVVGDSMAAAFGIEGVGPTCPKADQAAEWQNFHRSFPALLGEVFDADVYGTTYSGKGITKNVWRPDPWTMPLIFPLANPIDPTSKYDFSTFTPDVIVVGLGGLDFAAGQPEDDGPASIADFTAGYLAFLKAIRAVYPPTHILCIVGPAVSEEDTIGIHADVIAGVTAAVDTRKREGDDRVSMFLPSSPAPPSELTGCEGHGNASFHERLATEMTPVIRALTGW